MPDENSGAESPSQTDINLIADYFSRFCQFNQRPQTRKARYDFRMVFIACIIRMYQPSAYATRLDFILVKRGVIREIAASLQMPKSHVSELVRKAVTGYKIYEDFQNQVDQTMEVLADP